jgi:hypothetical protein
MLNIRNPRRWYRRGGAAALLAIASLAGTFMLGNVPTASATATGCHIWAYVVVDGYPAPTGEYCFGVIGSGTTVANTTGSYETAYLYNYSEVVRFYNSSGSNYATFYGPVHYGYAYGPHSWSTGIHGTAQAGGRVCGSLTSSGVAIATVCEGIS